MVVGLLTLILERPITASPENIAISQSDLPQGWNLTNSTIRWAHNSTIPMESGVTWYCQLELFNQSSNSSVWMLITSFNTTINAKSAHSNWFSTYCGPEWVFEDIDLGDEGTRTKTPYNPEGDNSNSYAEYFWREGNVWVQMEFRSGVILEYLPWMDDLAGIQASKIHQNRSLIHL